LFDSDGDGSAQENGWSANKKCERDAGGNEMAGHFGVAVLLIDAGFPLFDVSD
jgi:hypothetical protein